MLGRLILDILKNGPSNVVARHDTIEQNNPVHFDARSEHSNNDTKIKIDDANLIVRGRHGIFLANRFDRYLGYALTEYGEYGEYEHLFLESLLQKGDTVYEIGANIGSHTVALSNAVGPNGKIIAIEAQPSIFNVLCANLALNNISNVTPISAGCGLVAGSLICPIFEYARATAHNSGGVSLLESGNGVPVEITPLDAVVSKQNSKPPSLLKIDVEGMERDVILGGKHTIETHRPIIYIENDRPDRSPQLISALRSLNYRLWWHCPFLYNPNNFFQNKINHYPNIASFNMICIPTELGNHPSTLGLPEVINGDQHPLTPPKKA